MADPRSRTVDQTPRLKIELRVYDAIHAFAEKKAKSKFSYEIIASLLQLHGPSEVYRRRLVCEGCDWEGCDGEAPAWPCRTHQVVAGYMLNGQYETRIKELVTLQHEGQAAVDARLAELGVTDVPR